MADTVGSQKQDEFLLSLFHFWGKVKQYGFLYIATERSICRLDSKSRSK
jgi:hypothetical protein